jgi:NAD(P)-dependent dehydrogenase (short-subunit alcohol dehydrogenase family)
LSAQFSGDDWAVILGGSSGFGLASAQKLASHGMNVCVIHRDRRGAMTRITPEFEKLKASGVQVITRNVDALAPAKRAEIIEELKGALGENGRVRCLLHSIAFGNLKLIVPEDPRERTATRQLAEKLGIDEGKLLEAADGLLADGVDEMAEIATQPKYPDYSYLDTDDVSRTIHTMGTSLLDWVQDLHTEKMFADDARVFGLTSEGNVLAWKGYAAVSAAKVALESMVRSIAAEFAPYGIRCNVLQPGVTETQALAAIPGSSHLKAHARLRNPYRRLTTPPDVANVLYLLCLPEAAWINGEVVRIDGGEHISGSSS